MDQNIVNTKSYEIYHFELNIFRIIETDLGDETWWNIFKWNLRNGGTLQSRVIRKITKAPFYVSNHKDLNISFVHDLAIET
jgi:hypothetical protein